MNIILHDNDLHLRFAPLTLTRPVGDLRAGILTNAERWARWIPEAEISFHTEGYLSKKFPRTEAEDAVEVNASVIPNEEIAAAIVSLDKNQQLLLGETWLARRGTGGEKIRFTGQEPIVLQQRWDLYLLNDEVLVADFFLLTGGRTSQQLSRTNTVIGNEDLVFLEEGAVVEASERRPDLYRKGSRDHGRLPRTRTVFARGTFDVKNGRENLRTNNHRTALQSRRGSHQRDLPGLLE
jgi:hypothetical protein